MRQNLKSLLKGLCIGLAFVAVLLGLLMILPGCSEVMTTEPPFNEAAPDGTGVGS